MMIRDSDHESQRFRKERDVAPNRSAQIGRTDSCPRSAKSSPGSRSSSSPNGAESPSTPKYQKDNAGSQVSAARSCYDQPTRRRTASCRLPKPWQEDKYVKDECGSGIVPTKNKFQFRRTVWCRTPLTMYQATIGELGRQILCRETNVTRDIKPEPPCNVSEYILPLCRGYYRKKDCLRPCEEEYTTIKQGCKVYRDRVERYWKPCMTKEEKISLDVNAYAPHNVALGWKIKRKLNDEPCW